MVVVASTMPLLAAAALLASLAARAPSEVGRGSVVVTAPAVPGGLLAAQMEARQLIASRPLKDVHVELQPGTLSRTQIWDANSPYGL
eukprot:SAG31_NODE_4048_length_3637_cov_23.139062_2_plen_87_part_00